MEPSAEITVKEISDPKNPLYYTGIPIRDHTSQRQNWILLKTANNDEMLFIDGQHQSTLSDEHIYHETFVHNIMSQCKNPESILILGGAEGCMIREVLKWNSVKRIKQVDWDASLVYHFKHEGSYWNNKAYNNPIVEYQCEEANYWLDNNMDTFDIILIDLLDPSETNIEFIKKLMEKSRKIINPGGAFSINVGQVNLQNVLIPKLIYYMKTMFRIPHFNIIATRADVPSYKGIWCFLSAVPANHKINLILNILPNNLKYITTDKIIQNSTWNSYWLPSYQYISFLNPLYEDPKKLAEEQRELEAKVFGCYGC